MSDEHLGGWLSLDGNTYLPDIWEDMLAKGVSSVVDIGCGGGPAATWFKQHGCRVCAIDGDPAALEFTGIPEDFVLHDYTKGPFVPPGEWDLAWSAEFVEHVDEEYVPNFMATFAVAKTVLLTHAVPGQGGHHHVNCQEDDYWADIFAKYGFQWDAEASEVMRKAEVKSWGRPTIMLFHKLADQ